MSSKAPLFIILSIGILALLELFLYNGSLSHEIQRVGSEITSLDTHIREMQSEKEELQANITLISKAVQDIPKAVPASIYTGFLDHEELFVEFLDYLQSPAFDGVDAKFSFSDKQEMQTGSVPLHQIVLNFDFQFNELAEAQNFFVKILRQVKKYPLVVDSLKIHRAGDNNDVTQGGGEKELDGSLQVTFLVPAKLRQQVLRLIQGGKA